MKRLTLALTRQCNAQCIHCYEGNGRSRDTKNELPLESIVSLLDESVALGTKETVLVGGEPTLRSDLIEITAAAAERGLRVGLSTNGLALEQHVMEAFRAMNMWFLSFSLFSVDPDIHDRMAGVPGAFCRTWRSLRMAVGLELPATVAIPVCRMNAATLDRTIQVLFDMGVGCLTLLYITPAGAGRNLANEIVSLVTWRDRIDYLAAKYRFRSEGGLVQVEPVVARNTSELQVWSEAGYGGTCRSVTGDTVFVSSEGRVLPCSFSNPNTGMALWRPGALGRIVSNFDDTVNCFLADHGYERHQVPPEQICWAIQSHCPALAAMLESNRRKGYIPVCPFEIVPARLLQTGATLP